MAQIIEEPIKQRTYIHAHPEKVYDTITSGKGWDAFFTTSASAWKQAGWSGAVVLRDFFVGSRRDS